MKVLLCHSYYLQRGGEDCCFEEERDLLRAGGHEVVEYVRNNAELVGRSALSSAIGTVWNRRAAREMHELIAREQPAVVHCTNTFPLISPAVCHAAHRAGTPVVQALHNYRWLCAGAYLMRDGAPCEECLARRIPVPAVRHRCYRGSAAASAAVVGMQLVHRHWSRWLDKVDAFFTLTEFARQRFIMGGFPAERVHVKANSVSPDPGPGRGDGGYVAFVGRLSPEKGVATLLAAWGADQSLPPLEIAGDGPLAVEVRTASASDPRIRWRGRLQLDEVHRLVGGAAALVMPSVWYETFGRTIAEAFAAGTPAIVSRLGAMAELVEDGRTGWLFTPGDAGRLAEKVRQVQRLPVSALATVRRAARSEFEQRFTPAQNYARLLEIYAAAQNEAARRRGGAVLGDSRPTRRKDWNRASPQQSMEFSTALPSPGWRPPSHD
jgi:glycosyltransferase involved in cell wall biosynthesis